MLEGAFTESIGGPIRPQQTRPRFSAMPTDDQTDKREGYNQIFHTTRSGMCG